MQLSFDPAEIADRLVLDLPVLAAGSPQQYGPVDLAFAGFRDRLNMNFPRLVFAHAELVTKTSSRAWP